MDVVDRSVLGPGGIVALCLSLGPGALAAQQSTIEYIAHAAVVIESGPTRILIDPYNGSRWMGFGFPANLDVDAVLVTHPHYDHDARYYGGADTPVFTEPGSYRIGDVELIGVEGEHAGGDRYRGRGITPYNVIWTVVANGTRFTHVGDNRPLTDGDVASVGSTDVLFVPPFHQVEAALTEATRLGAGMVVPIHYRLPSMAAEGYGMPTVDDWLGDEAATRHDEYRLTLPHEGPTGVNGDPAGRPAPGIQPAIHVLSPHPGVSAWRSDLGRAWRLSDEASTAAEAGDTEGAVVHLTAATALAPEVMSFPLDLGERLTQLDRTDQAVQVWEAALARSGQGDIEPTLRILGALADAYVALGKTAEAEILQRQIQNAGRSYYTRGPLQRD